MSSPQSSITVVLLNLTTKHGWFARPERQNYNSNKIKYGNDNKNNTTRQTQKIQKLPKSI